MPKFRERLSRAWNAFNGRDAPPQDSGSSSYRRPDRLRLTRGNERSIITAIYSKIALDVSAVTIKHVLCNENGYYIADKKSGLNECLTLSANLDQTGRAFIYDAVMTMFDDGCVALVPTSADENPNESSTFDVTSMRVARITEWRPESVRVQIYNERTGVKEERYVRKDITAIIENPFYAVMNEQNSTMQRLLRKLAILDTIDDKLASKKWNIILQNPYDTSSIIQRNRAKARISELEEELANSEYGIAQISSTEKITQLNRPLENNLLEQVKYLTDLLYSQLGVTQELLSGVANEEQQLHYISSTMSPILFAITGELKRKFLTPTAISQGQSIMFFTDHFSLTPLNKLSMVIDVLKRNEIFSSNDLRSLFGMPPLDDQRSDMPINSNINPLGMEEQYTDQGQEQMMDYNQMQEAQQPQQEMPQEEAPADYGAGQYPQ